MAKDNTHYLYGVNTLSNLLARVPERVLTIYIEQQRDDERIQGIVQLAQQHGISIQPVPSTTFTKRLGNAVHQGVMAQVKPVPPAKEPALYEQMSQLTQPAFILCLDGVQDPHNLGACLRSADAAGVDAVVVPRDRACGITPTVSKVASGAAELVPFYAVTNLVRSLKALQEQGIWCVGLAGEASTSLFDTPLKGALALVMGAEGKGLRRLTRETCDSLAHLPMYGTVSSLNVSVSTGIALYEARRQQGMPD